MLPSTAAQFRWSTTRKYRLVPAEFNTSRKSRKFMPFFVSLTYPFQPLQTCSMSPVNPLPKCVFCKIIFARHLNLFWGGEACLGPEKAQLPGEGKRSPSVYGWTGTDRTRVKKFRIYRTSLKNSLSIRT